MDTEFVFFEVGTYFYTYLDEYRSSKVEQFSCNMSQATVYEI
jgi:hypothetical protein